MSLEPKKPIEELLEASAKARRAEFGSDPLMPNPMRARLHDEIARRARRDEPEARASWLRLWWPRLIIGAAAAALVIGAPLMWWRSQQPIGDGLRLATNQPAAADETNRLEVQSLPAPAAPAVRQDGDKGSGEIASAKSAAGSFADSSNETKSIDLAKAGEENSPALKKFAEGAIAPSASAPMAEGPPVEEKNSASVSAAPSASASFAQNRKTEATNLKQQFSQSRARQSFRGNAKAEPAANVLNTFQIEQDGAEIRVVDADGSTYTGKIEPVSKEKLKDDRAAAKAANETESNQFYFRAAGYNGSLKKSLVFEGNYIAAPSPQQKARVAASANVREPMPARIVGTAKINGESSVPVDAISVGP